MMAWKHQIFWVGFFLLASLVPAQEDNSQLLEKGKQCLYTGSYEMAREILEKIAEKSGGEAAREPLFEVYALTGEYDKALAVAKQIGAGKDKVRGQLLAGELLLRLGRYEEAKELFLESYQQEPDNVRVLCSLGMYYLRRGQRDKYLHYLGGLFDRYDPAQSYSAEELLYIARACRHYAMKSDDTDRSDTLKTLVQKMLPRAIAKDQYYFAAYQEMAEIFLEAFNTVDANGVLRDALQINAHHPDLLVLQTASQLQQFYSRPNALPTLQHALRINPKLTEAMTLEAMIYLSDQEYDKAEATLLKAVAFVPGDLTTRSLLAAVYYMTGRKTGYESECNKVLAINPNCGDLYLTLGNMIINKRLFSEAVAFYRRAIELDPFLWHAYIELGTNLMRLGDIPDAEKYLKKVEDEYNFHTQTHNTLILLRKYQEFKLYQTPHFKIRLHISEADVMQPLVSELLEDGYRRLTEIYGFAAETPILFELYPDHKDFSVRTIGLEALGASGVCFGKVVAAISPQHKPKAHNWASVIWHELTHVFTLQMTNYQIPRWLTEGLSEFSERQRNPSCQRGLDLELYSAYSSGLMRGISDLNAGFSRPRYPQEIVVCYYQATIICEFLVQTKGFPKVLDMLRMYGQEKQDKEVFQTVLGMSLEEFDRQFLAWLKANVFDKMSVFPTINPKEIEDLKDQIAEDPKNIAAHLKLSLGYLQQGRYTDAEIYASQLVALAPQDSTSFDILGYLAYEQKNIAKAKTLLEKAIQLGSQNFYTHSIMGGIYWNKKETAAAIQSFQRAKAGFPGYVRDRNPYEQLAQIYMAQGEKDKAIAELEELLQREAYDYPIRFKLGKEYFGRKQYQKASKLLTDARDIYPFDPELQSMLAQSCRAIKDWKTAKEAYLVYLILAPAEQRYQIYADLAAVCLELKEYEVARSYANKALGIKPDYQPAQDILDKLSK